MRTCKSEAFLIVLQRVADLKLRCLAIWLALLHNANLGWALLPLDVAKRLVQDGSGARLPARAESLPRAAGRVDVLAHPLLQCVHHGTVVVGVGRSWDTDTGPGLDALASHPAPFTR